MKVVSTARKWGTSPDNVLKTEIVEDHTAMADGAETGTTVTVEEMIDTTTEWTGIINLI